MNTGKEIRLADMEKVGGGLLTCEDMESLTFLSSQGIPCSHFRKQAVFPGKKGCHPERSRGIPYFSF